MYAIFILVSLVSLVFKKKSQGLLIQQTFKIFDSHKFLGLKISDFFENSSRKNFFFHPLKFRSPVKLRIRIVSKIACPKLLV